MTQREPSKTSIDMPTVIDEEASAVTPAAAVATVTHRELAKTSISLPKVIDEQAIVAMADAAAANPVCAPRGIIGSRTIRELGAVDLFAVARASDLVLQMRQTEGERHIHVFIIPAAMAFQFQRYGRLLVDVTPSFGHRDDHGPLTDVVSIAHGDVDAMEADELPEQEEMLSLLWLTSAEAVRFTVRRSALKGWLSDLDTVVKSIPLRERSAGIIDLAIGETRDIPIQSTPRPGAQNRPY